MYCEQTGKQVVAADLVMILCSDSCMYVHTNISSYILYVRKQLFFMFTSTSNT